MSDKEVRIGVIGTGMGRLHMQAYSEVPGARITAICDLNEPEAQSFAQKYGAPHTYTDYRDLFASGEIDAVSIAIPN